MCVIAGAVGAGVAGAATSAVVGSALGGGSGGGNSGAQQASAQADPFASQRPQYQQMLSNLISNPSSVTSTPGYQFQMQQALAGVEGSAAANGMINSGNVLSALTTQAGNQASTGYYNQAELLAQLAGANIGSPGEAGAITQGQNVLNQQGTSALAGSVGNAVTSGINSYIGGGNSYYSSGMDPFATDTSGYGAGSNTYGFTSGVGDSSYGVSYGFGV